MQTAKSLLLCFHLPQLPCQLTSLCHFSDFIEGVQGSERWWTAGQCLTLAAKPTVWLERRREDEWHLEAGLDLCRITSWAFFMCWLSWLSYKFNLLLVEEVFLACLCCFIDTPPPHMEKSHWLIWPIPSTRLMGPADASSLPVKIYVPTRLAINHRTCSVGSKLWQEAKSRAIHYRGFASTSEPHPHNWLEEHQQDW